MDSVENLDVERYSPDISIDENLSDIEKIIKKFQNHPSILKIKENVRIGERFEFQDSNDDKMFRKLISLDPKIKSAPKSSAPK